MKMEQSQICYLQEAESPASFFFNKIKVSLISFFLSVIIISVILPSLTFWYLTKTAAGEAILNQISQNAVQYLNQLMNQNVLNSIFIGSIYPLFMLGYASIVILHVLETVISMDVFPLLLYYVLKLILSKKLIHSKNKLLKVKKNLLARIYLIITKFCIFTVLLIIFILIFLILGIKNVFTVNTPNYFAYVISTMSKYFILIFGSYLFCISFLNTLYETLFIPPLVPLSGSIDKFIKTGLETEQKPKLKVPGMKTITVNRETEIFDNNNDNNNDDNSNNKGINNKEENAK